MEYLRVGELILTQGENFKVSDVFKSETGM